MVRSLPAVKLGAQYFVVRRLMPLCYRSAAVELRHLRYFVAVADEMNFTKAAHRLRVAQPALSRQIRQLEDELGVKLFERNRRTVALTESGEVFLVEARNILAQSAQAMRMAQEKGEGTSGRLKIGYVWGLFHTLTPPLLAHFRHQFPNVTVDLLDMTATEQAQALVDRRLDAGFIGFAHEADALGLAKYRVGSSSFVAALPAGHRLARKRTLALRELANELLIAISDGSYPGAWKCVLQACSQAGFSPRTLQAAERGFTILGLVASGCGIAILPESLRALPHPGIVFRPLDPAPAGDLFLAWNGNHRARLRESFVGFIEQQPGT
jgi:DNA-binding transcriptional LysR family regulator